MTVYATARKFACESGFVCEPLLGRNLKRLTVQSMNLLTGRFLGLERPQFCLEQYLFIEEMQPTIFCPHTRIRN